MMKWQHLFHNRILELGKELLNDDAVGDIFSENGMYSAKVYEWTTYDTRISIINGKLTGMACNCSLADEGRRCSHMAALLFKMEKEQRINASAPDSEPEEGGYSFASSLKNGDEYRYFKIENITKNLIISQSTYEKAKNILSGRTAGEINCTFGYSQTNNGSRKLLGHVGFKQRGFPGYESAFVEFNNEGLIRRFCRDSYCCGSGYHTISAGNPAFNTPCEHQIALLIYLERYLEKNNPGDSTDLNAGKMLKEYKSRLIGTGRSEKVAEKREISLIPRLTKTFGELRASFRVGQEKKMYVVKDLPALVDAAEAGEELPLGTKLELNFAADRFEPGSKKYYDLIRRYVKETRQRDDGVFGRDHVGTKQDLVLYGSILDDFFDAAEDSSLECTYLDGGKKEISFSDSFPEITLSLLKEEDSNGVFQGVQLHGELPEVLSGAKYEYFLSDGCLYRVQSEKTEKIRPLLDNANGRFLSMHIGRMNLTEFYYDILPLLRESIAIEEEKDFNCEAFLPPEAEFTFYLDAENGIPFCKGEACYGDVSYLLTDWFRRESDILYSRDEIREVSAVKDVYEFFPNVSPSEGKFVAVDDQEAIYRIMTDGVDRLCSLGRVMSTSAFDSIKVRRKIKVRIGVSIESDLLNLSVSSEDISMEELYDLLSSYRQKKSYHRLKNGEFVSIDESIVELGEMIDSLRLTPKEFIRGNMDIPAYRALYLDRMLEKCDDVYINRDWHYRQLIKNFKTVEDSDYEVPPTLEKIMRPYQKYGYKWIRTLAQSGFGGILADDMGLGKTIQMIAVLLSERDEGAVGTSMVVCPASLVFNWVDEFSRFAPDLKICPVVGGQRERQAIIERYAKWDVLITSYDLLKRDAPFYEEIYFLYEILDEAQYIKTFSTSAARSAKIIRAKHRFALTGTPIENRLSELWSIFDFLMPGFLYEYEVFRTDLEIPIAKRHDNEASAILRKMVSPFILRRIKNDVLKDLPPKTEETRSVKFGEDQQILYDAQVVRMKNLILEKTEEEFGKNRIQILAELTKIRQICCDPSLLFDNYLGKSAKRDAVIELIRSAIDGGHKMLLFSQFTSMLDLLKKDLDNEKIQYYEITGATPKQDRLKLVNQFNSNEVPLFLISLKAGGTGLNLVGADIVIHYDPWWNAAAQNQATDRAYRIGQAKPVTVFKLIAKNTIEEKIQKMQEMKLSLADEIISGTSASLGSLSRDELLELFE